MLATLDGADAAQHRGRVDLQRVVAAGEIDALDALQLVRHQGRREVEHQVRARQCQRVGAGAAVGQAEREIADDQPVVACSAVEHVRPAAARQHVVAVAADQHLGRRRAGGRHRRAERAAEHDIARAGIAAVGIRLRGSDDQVVVAVAVHVARRRHREAATVERRDAHQLEAVGTVQARWVDVGGKARSLAKDDVRRAGVGHTARIGRRSADDQVIVTVAVDVARRRDRVSGEVERSGTTHPEAGGAVQGRQVEGSGKARCLAEHDIARTGKAAVRIGGLSTDDEVIVAVAVNVACRGDRKATLVLGRRAAQL